jgi:hypothetical protein
LGDFSFTQGRLGGVKVKWAPPTIELIIFAARPFRLIGRPLIKPERRQSLAAARIIFRYPNQLSDFFAAGFSDLDSFLGVVSLLAETEGDDSALDLRL